ncbi:MAG: hypothetical protein ACHBNF_12425 [Chromatiales bacterium]
MYKGTAYAVLLSVPVLFIAYVAVLYIWITFIEPVVSFLSGPFYFLRFAIPAWVAMWASLSITSRLFRHANYERVTIILVSVVVFNVISRLILAIYRGEEWFVIEKLITVGTALFAAKETFIRIESDQEEKC